MSRSRIKVVKGLPPTYKRQRTKFTVAQLRAVPMRTLRWEEYQLMDEVTSNPNITYAALADAYRWPIGTVKSRLNRARAKLNKHLEDA